MLESGDSGSWSAQSEIELSHGSVEKRISPRKALISQLADLSKTRSRAFDLPRDNRAIEGNDRGRRRQASKS